MIANPSMQPGAASAAGPSVPRTAPLGVTVMPEWFAHEGIDAVLDRVQSLGCTSIATSPYVLEAAAEGQGAREPPPDGDAGRVRPLDRPLFGRTELWVRTAPSFRHDLRRYADLRYRPGDADALTERHAELLDRAIETAAARGLTVRLQLMAASPPGYRVQFSGAIDDDQCLGPDGLQHPHRVDRNASLASRHVVDYTATLVAELAHRYPGVAAFRLDWPEYPPYDFRSALFDFSRPAVAAMEADGVDVDALRRDALALAASLRSTAAGVAAAGVEATADALADAGLGPMLRGDGRLAPLWVAKRESARRLLAAVRKALDAVPGPYRRLEPQVFPPPFHRISGFPLGRLHGIADAVGIKLYTMHWPMIARYWARDLVGADASVATLDTVTAAIARLFALVDDAAPDGATLRYPEPHEAHPVGVDAQASKLADAASISDVPVIAYAHAYGPLDDVMRRCAIAAASGLPWWINRYGYLSDAKLAALRDALGGRA